MLVRLRSKPYAYLLRQQTGILSDQAHASQVALKYLFFIENIRLSWYINMEDGIEDADDLTGSRPLIHHQAI